MKTSVNFLDSDRVKVIVNIEIENGRVSFTGDYSGSSGQIVDHIKPANDAQKELVEMWDKWHLNDLKAGTPKQMEIVKDCKSYNESITALGMVMRDGSAGGFNVLPLFAEITHLERELDGLKDWAKKANEENSKYFKENYEKLTKQIETLQSLVLSTMVYDIHPVTGELYKYGSGWLSVDIPEDIEEEIERIIEEIEEAEEERKGEPLTGLKEDELIKLIEDKTNFSGRDAELCAAFVYMFDLCENDLEDVDIDGTRCTIQGTDYLAGDDDEMNDAWDEDLENYIDDCLEIPAHMANYFDRDAWKRDAKYDGRGHSLNRYDGGEEEQQINGTYYYAYRQ